MSALHIIISIHNSLMRDAVISMQSSCAQKTTDHHTPPTHTACVPAYRNSHIVIAGILLTRTFLCIGASTWFWPPHQQQNQQQKQQP